MYSCDWCGLLEVVFTPRVDGEIVLLCESCANDYLEEESK